MLILFSKNTVSKYTAIEFVIKQKRTQSIDIVQRLMRVFAVSADNLLNDSEDSVVEMQNHELNEQLMLINQLDEDEKNALIKIINSMLTKKRMKDLLDGKVNF